MCKHFLIIQSTERERNEILFLKNERDLSTVRQYKEELDISN